MIAANALAGWLWQEAGAAVPFMAGAGLALVALAALGRWYQRADLG
jgi:hypothetical protein